MTASPRTVLLAAGVHPPITPPDERSTAASRVRVWPATVVKSPPRNTRPFAAARTCTAPFTAGDQVRIRSPEAASSRATRWRPTVSPVVEWRRLVNSPAITTRSPVWTMASTRPLGSQWARGWPE